MIRIIWIEKDRMWEIHTGRHLYGVASTLEEAKQVREEAREWNAR